MRFHSLALVLIIIGATILIGCSGANKVTKIQQGNSNPQTAYADGARRVTTIELQDLLKKNEAFVIDVRNDASFKAGHIPGAKLIPATEILNHVDELPKDKLIVTYCS
jgi:3-mercaptopyruvate sulfurtransferase SseA